MFIFNILYHVTHNTHIVIIALGRVYKPFFVSTLCLYFYGYDPILSSLYILKYCIEIIVIMLYYIDLYYIDL